MYQKYINQTYFLGLTLTLFLLTGCEKFVEVDVPVTGLTGSVVYSKDATAAAAVNGIVFNVLSQNFSHGHNGITALMGLAADELDAHPSNPHYQEYYKNKITSASAPFWSEIYSKIYECNEALEGINNSTTLSPTLKNQLLGEAKFLRAFLYFYAVNLFGDVPLILTTDYKVNSLIPRTTSLKVWERIISDLVEAQELLPVNYYAPQGGVYAERVLPVKAAASALLARVYLYQEDWVNAAEQATTVIEDSKFTLNSDLLEVFKKNSTESIWQLGAISPIPTIPGSTTDGYFFVLLNAPDQSINPVSLSQSAYNLFDMIDERKTAWIGTFADNTNIYFYANKYKTSSATGLAYTEYLTVLRLAEQYLIRAEANAHLNKLSEASEDLNNTRIRAGLAAFSSGDKDILLDSIANEKRREFFCEWGHRWFDLKRTKTIDQVMPVIAINKGTTWKSEYQLLPIPLSEIQLNPNMVQNKGY
jgi:starch-binding outer membrane protein, SusD/RagB family